MKNRIVLFTAITLMFSLYGCQKAENDYMQNIPADLKLIKNVKTTYRDHTVTDKFTYDASFQVNCIERSERDYVYLFYYSDKKLSEQRITVNDNGNYVTYNVTYTTEGNLAISNDTSAYIFSEAEDGFFRKVSYLGRKPFGEWNEVYSCNFTIEHNNIGFACGNQLIEPASYDGHPNPLAGYGNWGMLFKGLYVGTANNPLHEGYQYEYDLDGYPIRLVTPTFYREYHYYE